MLALLEAFFQIMTRRRGPEDLPDSVFLLQVLIAIYLACQLPVGVIMYGWTGTTLALILADLVLLGVFFWTVLRATGNAPRFRQTLSALLGTGALLSLVQAHITARALSRHLGIGMVVALAYFVLSFQVSTRISPPVTG